MIARRTFSLLATLLVVAVPLRAQGPPADDVQPARGLIDPANGLSLDDAIARALAHDPTILSVRQQLGAAQGERLQAGLRPNPTVAFEQRTEPAGSDSLTTAGIEWPLDLFRRPARAAVADARVRAVSHGITDRERILIADVRAAYGDVLVAIRNLTVLERVIGATSGQLAVVAARVDEGRSARLERDLLQVEVRRLEADRLLQIGAVEAALMELKRRLGLPSYAPLSVSEGLEAHLLSEGEVPLPGDDPGDRPDIRAAEAMVDVADASLHRAQQEGRFDASLYGGYMRMDAGFAQLGLLPDGGTARVRGVFHYLTGGVRVTWPMRNRNQGAVAAARADLSGAHASLDATRLLADAERAAAMARDRRARAAVGPYTGDLLALARQNLSTVEQSYELGRLTLLDVLMQRRRYLDVEQAYTEAMRAAYEARTALRLATGGGR